MTILGRHGTRLRQFQFHVGCSLDDFDELLTGYRAVFDQGVHQAFGEEQGCLSVRMHPKAGPVPICSCTIIVIRSHKKTLHALTMANEFQLKTPVPARFQGLVTHNASDYK